MRLRLQLSYSTRIFRGVNKLESGSIKTGNNRISKEEFCGFCHLLYDRNLVSGVGGNVAARTGNQTFLTPSGYSLRDMKPDLVVTINKTGEIQGSATPTKDVNMHLLILRARAEVNVVCHIHGADIIAASAMLDPGPDALPPITPGFVYFAYPLPMIPFMVPGTETLARTVSTQLAINNSRAVLLQNHGLVTLGRDFSGAPGHPRNCFKNSLNQKNSK